MGEKSSILPNLTDHKNQQEVKVAKSQAATFLMPPIRLFVVPAPMFGFRSRATKQGSRKSFSLQFVLYLSANSSIGQL